MLGLAGMECRRGIDKKFPQIAYEVRSAEFAIVGG
jgi:hypothetical protein